MTYKTIHDACQNKHVTKEVQEALKQGNTEVWYLKQGVGMLDPIQPDRNNLQSTHTLLGKIACKDAELCYNVLQGENWSPNGEAFNMIQAGGHSHTSMSVGDCLVIDNKTVMCAIIGFYPLS